MSVSLKAHPGGSNSVSLGWHLDFAFFKEPHWVSWMQGLGTTGGTLSLTPGPSRNEGPFDDFPGGSQLPDPWCPGSRKGPQLAQLDSLLYRRLT